MIIIQNLTPFQSTKMDKNTADKIFGIFYQINPEPKTELYYTNDYNLLVAIILSAQSTDVGVNKATNKFFNFITTPAQMLELGEEGLKDYIKTIGLYNNKAKNIIAMSSLLVEKYNSTIPYVREELELLPGVGRKTANVFLNCTKKLPVIAVDTHVFRVGNRIGLVNTKTPLETEKQLLKIIPQKWLTHAHHWLILHGRYICKAKNPKCLSCPIYDYCQYDKKIVIKKYEK
jgi:endonuclease III